MMRRRILFKNNLIKSHSFAWVYDGCGWSACVVLHFCTFFFGTVIFSRTHSKSFHDGHGKALFSFIILSLISSPLLFEFFFWERKMKKWSREIIFAREIFHSKIPEKKNQFFEQIKLINFIFNKLFCKIFCHILFFHQETTLTAAIPAASWRVVESTFSPLTYLFVKKFWNNEY